MKDRRTEVIGSLRYNGIDFVEIADPSQTMLRVHFLNAVQLGTLASPPRISGGETIPTVAVKPIAPSAWGFDQGHLVLSIEVVAPGDFSTYTLAISSPRLDRYFDHVRFSFKALCPSDLDCEQAPAPCPPLPGDAPPIDYLAKDFLSFRQALLDFSALRYPQWQERSEADFGVMFAEALSAIADDLSYTQDRYAAEAALVTATQRRSVIRHAELVDYTPGPTLSSSVMLQFNVGPGVQQIPAGVVVIARAPDGTPTYFETGPSLSQRLLDQTGARRATPPQVPVSALWNSGLIEAYWFDDSKRCLEAGATQMHVRGRGYGFTAGQQLLIETPGATTADPALLQIVTLTAVEEECDPIFTRVPDGAGPPFMTCPTSPPSAREPTAVTRLVWATSDALAAARDLTRTHVVGNIVPATQGLTVANEAFVVAASASGSPATATTIVRTGPRPTQPDGTPGTAIPLQLYSLTRGPVAWLPNSTGAGNGGTGAQPEILLLQQGAAGPGVPWSWTPQLVTAGPFDNAYTLDAARFAMIARNSDLSAQFEYAGDNGDTIRFGGNSFGILPDDGASFTVTYRVGVGAAGNVAAGAINQIDAASPIHAVVTNPLPATGGADPEPLSSVQLLAPQAFRAQQFRAVLPSDYQAAAETLPWVQRAGTSFRWTGSWLSVFTAADPLHSEQITTAQRTGLIELLNRYRMAGYESYVPDPDYISLDLAVSVCAAPTAFAGDVESGVLAALDPGGISGGGFFNVDNFTFGQPLERSRLEAAIQSVAGVAGVSCIQYRLRNRLGGMVEMGDTVTVGTNQILRCDNDPSLPEHGSIHVAVSGGR